ncbi:SRPBCC domain-containing protein [Georgenia ruanii]|uniref:SRPBCC domain-containing protein n=1 Tax=Georgenia ruanii TaxID=348442 RepID=A0A7J9V042_9MICO|nr:SRPBCC domain-containing protein [Georgenia ruanii]MPV90249.1 SRPBCC domain-containing protein [Georgenia ruanii]
MTGYEASATTDVAALPHTVWTALTTPELAATYMFGATVTSDFEPGGAITFAGTWEGRPYEDHGTVLDAEEPRLLRYTHVSSGGRAETPEDRHTLTFTLEEIPDGTRVTLVQDNNATPEAAEHARQNWVRVLEALRLTAERLGG